MKYFVWCGLILALLGTPVSGKAHLRLAPPVVADRQVTGPFAGEIAAFEAADKKSPPPSGGILFLGSSSIRLWTTLAQDFPGLPVINRGFGGSQIADSVRYADRIVLPYKPKMIVFYAGGNDLNAGKSPDQVLKDFQALVEKVHAALPDTRIVYISINPSIARWSQEANVLATNQLIQRFVHARSSRPLKLAYLNSHSQLLDAQGQPRPEILRADGLHLNAQGYQEWTAILRPHIEALWKATTR